MTRPQRSTATGLAGAALVAVLVIALVGCGRDAAQRGPARPPVASSAPASSTAAGAPSSNPAPLQSIDLRLEPVASVAAVTAFATRPGDDDALYVAEKQGVVRRIVGTTVDSTAVLDIRSDVRNEGERGLLGIAFSPDGTRLYVHFSDRNGDTRLDEFAMPDARGGTTADSATRRVVLTQQQPFSNHNGGQVAFGPDGLLYLGLGDGGGQGDPKNNAQNRNTLLGKILRIDPRPNGAAPYSVPADNPFVRDANARPELYVYGLRNPWRFSFDTDGTLWIGDVGQNAWEEISRLPAGQAAGANLGWNAFEGRDRFKGTPPENTVMPVITYPNPDRGCSVIGGGVYRGRSIPALVGTYLYSDFCAGDLRGAVVDAAGTVRDERSWSGATAESVTTISRGPGGEWFVGTNDGAVLRVTAA